MVTDVVVSEGVEIIGGRLPVCAILIFTKLHGPSQLTLYYQYMSNLHNTTLSRRTMTMRSNDTLVDTPFQLISGFFHVNQGVLCCEHAEQASSRGVLGGGGQQAC